MKYFVYFSWSGNGDYIASFLKERGYEPVKVETLKPLGKVNFFRILKYGFKAMGAKKTPVKDIVLELKEDDQVIIGSPIWNDRLSTPINTVLGQFDFNKDNTKFILYPAGEDTKKSLEQIANLGFVEKPIIYAHPLKSQEKAVEILKDL